MYSADCALVVAFLAPGKRRRTCPTAEKEKALRADPCDHAKRTGGNGQHQGNVNWGHWAETARRGSGVSARWWQDEKFEIEYADAYSPRNTKKPTRVENGGNGGVAGAGIRGKLADT